MPSKPKGFIAIRGTFRVLGRNKNGAETGFQPDGDSMQFKPQNPALLNKLTRLSAPFKLSSIGSTQLRFEGIDSLELHFQGTTQPRPPADTERDKLVSLANVGPLSFKASDGVTVVPPAPHDKAPGYIISRSLEVHGRPVAFVFTGSSPVPDGASIHLDGSLLRQSLNYAMLKSGNAYPLYYESLFFDLRAILQNAVTSARQARLGLWKSGTDLTQSGVRADAVAVLESRGICFPKLFRRLVEFYADKNLPKNRTVAQFKPWLATKREPVEDLKVGQDTHLDTFVSVSGLKVSLTRDPNQLKFFSSKSAGDPWVKGSGKAST